ncbi:hypothetical protein ACJZ2D_002536 [Fusarium nematophilum]
MALFEDEKYIVAHAALVVLTAWIPSFILFFCALCLCRRRNDPVRTAFTWLKLAFFVFADFCFFDACSYGLLFAYSRIRNDDYDIYDTYDTYTVLKSIDIAQGVTNGLAQFFDMIVDILVMIILVRVASGITVAQTGKVDPLGSITRLASYGIAALLAILAVAAFALRMRYISGYYEDYGYLTNDDINDFWIKGRQIGFSFRVLIFVVSLGVVARSVMVKLQPKSEKTLSWCSSLLVAASIVWLTRTIYNMASIAAWAELDEIYNKTFEWYYIILDLVFAIWTQFTVLCLVFAIGTAKSNGLWSPPPHEEALGFNHQANGSPPQSTPQQYVEKA